MTDEIYMDKCDIPSTLPVVSLKSTVLFPWQVVSVQIAVKQNIKLLEQYSGRNEIVAAGMFLDPEGSYRRSNLSSAAVACRVLSRIIMDHDVPQVVLQGIRRIHLSKIISTNPFFQARIDCVDEPNQDGPVVRRQIERTSKLIENLVDVSDRYTEELVKVVRLNLENASRFADLIGDTVQFTYKDKRRLIETADVTDRLTVLIELLEEEIARELVSKEVLIKTEHSIDQKNRETFLREQLTIIRNELEEMDPAEAEIAGLAEKIESVTLPPFVAEEAHRQIQRLHDSGNRLREGSSIRAYIEWVLEFPWTARTKERLDIRRARRVLNNRYFSLGNASDRLLEFLAVRKLGGQSSKPLLAIIGPPGTGRTSLASTVAEILGHNLIQISMNGLHDEKELRGEPRVHAAARPGLIMDGLRRTGARNPVILIDEIDQLEPGAGDPLPALIEALDPARNCQFYDHYLGVPFDLSEALFIVTANVDEEIPTALWSLIHAIELSGYTEGVKMAIVRERVWPQVVEAHGLSVRDTRLTNAALKKIIRLYTREAGVHTLKNQLEKICRRLAVRTATGGAHRLSVNSNNLEKYLGKPIYPADHSARKSQVGVVNGLAWTETGGQLLPVEALLMPGEGAMMLTGLLGEVMQESVAAAISYVRSRAAELDIPPETMQNKDIHIHFPEGAIPKDGPSAGIAVATAIASVWSNKPVRPDVAMTGEISLRGQILPIGGLREKVLAAYRAGITHVILPRGNESDLADVPRDVLGKMHPHLVEEAVEVFRIALEKKPRNHSRRR
jgi:ATP-dependent Lon protease